MDDTERPHRTLERDADITKSVTLDQVRHSREVREIEAVTAHNASSKSNGEIPEPESNIAGSCRIMDGSDKVNEMRAASY